MSYGRNALALVAAIFTAAIAASPALAEKAFGEQLAGSPIYDGFRGFQNIRTDPATVADVGFIHPIQAILTTSQQFPDFVAVGTYNSAGAQGTCADDYDPLWSIYVDWQINGLYDCGLIAQDVYGVGNIVSFQVSYGTCNSLTRWTLTFASVVRACAPTTSHTSAYRLLAGLETSNGATDRNIDVKYSSLQTNFTGSSTWSDFGNSGGAAHADPNYTYAYVSNQAFNVYLAPLN